MASVYICQYDGCEEEATAGRFGHTYCQPHFDLIQEEKEAEKEMEKEARRAERAEARARRGSRPAGRGMAQLHRELKQASLALAMLPFMATGNAGTLANPAVTAVLDERADTFASSWCAVAEANPVVRAWLLRLLSGGVWINAGIQTAAFGYTVAIFAGVTPMHPAAMVLMPDMAQFVYAPNGNGGGGETANVAGSRTDS